MVSLDSSVVVPKDVVFREIAGESVLLDLRTGEYFGLNEVGTRIWSLLAETGSLGLAHERLLEEFEVDPSQLRRDLLSLVEELARRCLVDLDDG